MTIRTYARNAPPLSGALFNLDDLADLDHRHGEPRVYDFTLARALGYQHARNIRRLIKSSRVELEMHGSLIETEDRTGGTGDLLPPGANARAGRPGKAFYLNEAQALVICALTRTAVAARVRGELIRVYMLWRARELREFPKQCVARLIPAERMALQALLAHADVVMAPPYCEVEVGCYRPPYMTADGHVPYVLAPITEGILATLEAFEADDGCEDSADYEPSIGGFEGDEREGDDCDYEDNGDREPNLGAPEKDENNSQAGWALGRCDDAEDDGIGGGRMLGMDRLRAIQRKAPRLDRGMAARQAARELRKLVGVGARHGLRPYGRGNLTLLS